MAARRGEPSRPSAWPTRFAATLPPLTERSCGSSASATWTRLRTRPTRHCSYLKTAAALDATGLWLIRFAGSHDGWALEGTRNIWATTDGGETWSQSGGLPNGVG